MLAALNLARTTGESQQVLSTIADHRQAWKIRIGVLRTEKILSGFLVTAETVPLSRDWAVEVQRLKDELKERLHEIEAARRTDEERKNFLAMLSHELRNPLAGLAGAVHILRARRVAHGDAVATQALRAAERQIRHQTRLLDDLLEGSRVILGKIVLRSEAVDLAEVVRHAVEAVEGELRMRAQHMEMTVPVDALWVNGDETRLEQIVINLLGNAIKFTGPGGRITVTAEARDDLACLRVRDDGIGLEPAVLDRIFDLFTQADNSAGRAAGGLGIGLTLARRLVEMHGGTITARSDGRGRGSEFEVRLSRSAPGSESAPEPVAEADSPRRAARKVLVVDDNRDARDMLRALLEMDGHRVETAADGQQAIRLAVEASPDIAIIDLGLPGMDGYEVGRQIRRRVGDGVRLVALTGYGDEESVRQTREAGFTEHLVKPVDVDRLARLIAAA